MCESCHLPCGERAGLAPEWRPGLLRELHLLLLVLLPLLPVEPKLVLKLLLEVGVVVKLVLVLLLVVELE